jgi:hypothetical protein
MLMTRAAERTRRRESKPISNQTTEALIQDILEAAGEERCKAARHLVGSTLALCFPEARVANMSYSTTEIETGQSGRFEVNSSEFHVVLSPTQETYDEYLASLKKNVRLYLLVPDDMVFAVRYMADALAPGRIVVVTIAGFVSQCLEVLAGFEETARYNAVLRLIHMYNRRIDEVERD